MKTLIYICLFYGLFLLSITGCKKLDQTPVSTATNESVFNSQQGLDLYANSFYNILPQATDIQKSDQMSDYGARNTVPDFIRDGGFTARTSSGWSWGDLRNINYFIENCNNPLVLQSVRENYIGLARFFRAYFYFEKVKRFGDVPWIGKTFKVDDPGLFAGRDSRTLVMDSIIADLNYATAHITSESNTAPSLVNKFTAYGLKSRVCLFEGTFRKYHTEYNLTASAAGLLTQAAEAAKKVIDANKYSINTAGAANLAYRNVFISTAPVASEVMLAAVVDPALAVFHDANWWWTSSTYGARLSFTRTFINTYLNIDGTPFTNLADYKTRTFMQETKNRDLRLQQTIRLGSYKRVTNGKDVAAPPVFSYTYTGYQPIKFVLDNTSYDSGNLNNNPLPQMRYAEILLNYAEAKAELGTLTDADWNITVGALRRRAGITGGTTSKPTVIDPYMKANYFTDVNDASLMEIRRERGIELSLEGFRFPDIIRWKHGELMQQVWNGFYVPALNTPLDLNEDGVNDVVFYQNSPGTQQPGVTYVNVTPTISTGVNPQQLTNGTSGEITWLNNVPRKFEQKNYLYPIPEADRLINPKLGQNPGW